MQQNIFSKFDNVKIQSGIPLEDKEYIVKVINETKQFYEDNKELNSIIKAYITEHPRAEHIRYECKYPEVSDPYDKFDKELAEGCAYTIKKYFEEKYNIEINWLETRINELTKYKQDDTYYDSYSNTLSQLSADKIFDILTTGLEGITLNELQLQQLKQRLYEYSNNTYLNEKHWNLKNKTLTINNFVYISSYSYRTDYQNKFKDLFIALTRIFTNTEDFSMLNTFKQLLTYAPFQKYCSEDLPDKYEVADEYLSYFQIFNNGNLKISFKSELHAKKFAKEFLE